MQQSLVSANLMQMLSYSSAPRREDKDEREREEQRDKIAPSPLSSAPMCIFRRFVKVSDYSLLLSSFFRYRLLICPQRHTANAHGTSEKRTARQLLLHRRRGRGSRGKEKNTTLHFFGDSGFSADRARGRERKREVH